MPQSLKKQTRALKKQNTKTKQKTPNRYEVGIKICAKSRDPSPPFIPCVQQGLLRVSKNPCICPHPVFTIPRTLFVSFNTQSTFS
jgi:hypothetical protein